MERRKILDFGLAKALDPPLAPSPSPFEPSGKGWVAGATEGQNSPTISAAASRDGIILGTAAYMSPEQARGKPVDRRADIWAFGCVLNDMLTGNQTFAGETLSDVLAAVIQTEPDFAVLPLDTPPRIRDLLARSLNKNSKNRLRDIGDARLVIEASLDPSRAIAVNKAGWAEARATRRSQTIVWSLAVLAAISIGVTFWSLLRGPPPPTRPIARLVVTLPPSDRLALGNTPVLSLSPDGSRLVYVANHSGSTQLHVRAIGRFEATPIPGTEGAESPFFSPDGQSGGFFAEGKLKRVSLSGGAPFTVCSAASNRGGSWGPDDIIIFTPSPVTGLFRVSAAGGSPKPVAVPDRKKGELSYRWPQILPGGKAVLVTIWNGITVDAARIDVLSLETGKHRVVVDGGTYARYVPSGHLVYARAGGLLAVPFDLKRLQVTGSPVSILEGVSMNPDFGAAEFSSSADGSLAYVAGGSNGGESTFLWVDRKGVAQPLPAPPRAYTSPRLSPDGRRLAGRAAVPDD